MEDKSINLPSNPIIHLSEECWRIRFSIVRLGRHGSVPYDPIADNLAHVLEWTVYG
jgi:hypothetical protein